MEILGKGTTRRDESHQSEKEISVLAATVQGKGSTRVNKDYQAANQSTENTKGLDSSDTIGTLDKFTVIYSNVDSLPNKKQELISFINNASCKPKIIALAEVKHKNKWEINLSELAIPGYSIISNNLNTNFRGIIVYVRQDLVCKQLNYDSRISEFVFLEIACEENKKLTLGVFYRSQSSNVGNDLKLFYLINGLCAAKIINLLCLGDFNWPYQLVYLDDI